MQMPQIAILLFVAGLLSLRFPAIAQAQATTAFDGGWSVVLTCTAAPDGALGYTYRFPAQVSNGVFHGEKGSEGMPGWLVLDGQINPDGSSSLFAKGLTGAPKYNVGEVRKLTPYSYHVTAQFNPTAGTGTRTEVRPCSLVFSKFD